jgi:hypothetical protein
MNPNRNRTLYYVVTAVIVAALALLVIALVDDASAGSSSYSSSSSSRSSYSSSSSSRSSSSSSSGSKSYSSGGGTKSSGYYSGGSKSSSYGSSKPIFSSTSKTTTKVLPAAPPKVTVPTGATKPPVSVPSGRSYSTDRSYIISHRSYSTPTSSHYYGYYDPYGSNPYFYLWLYGAMDDNRHDNPPPPGAGEGQIDASIVSYLQVIKAEASR